MQPDYLDRYSRLDGPMHRLGAGLKLGVALGLVLITVIMPLRWWWVAGLSAGLVVVACLSRVPKRFLLTRLVMVEPLVLGVSILLLWQPGGGMKFLTVFTKSTLCLCLMILLSVTTPFSETLSMLRRARVPSLLVTTLALMYRYLFVLVDEAQRMQRARRSRTFRAGRWMIWQWLGTMLGQLFVRSTERAERIYAAMCARGWR